MPGVCAVCDAPAHGVHFLVNTCRACATFFRRAVAEKRSFSCRRATKNCRITKNEPMACRYCRLQKCIKLGMKVNAPPPRPTMSSCSCTQTEPFPNETRSDDCQNKAMVYDGTRLVQDLRNILTGPGPKNLPPSTSRLRTLQYSYRSLRVQVNVDDLQIKESVTFTEMMATMFDWTLRNLATWAMSCEEFSSLDFNDKWIAFKHLWRVAQIPEPVYRTTELLGNDTNDSRLLLPNGVVIDMVTATPAVEDKTKKDFLEFNKTNNKRIMRNISIPLKEAKPTEFEFVFLLAQCLWNDGGCDGLSEPAIEVANQYREEISKEIHDYYVEELRMHNYAPRLARIMNLFSEWERHSWMDRDEFMYLTTFDIFKCPEMENGLL
ncbi:hypothetical protein QR680_007410 [Steinernema hermaphroditum]|uniref:Nuclear receptor domain-containing protein n=1 Tax=Steinernema hermaphroditum TaxID=289476 RepID=A0AA39ID33_9BILA|nr:hypothetical protein QR680_007410 [Steinernema hermaphroditum]